MKATTVFLGGAVTRSDLKRLDLNEEPQVAFAGRSNVGKSSLLNALTGLKVARVSSAPGKTREMNFFRWGSSPINTWVLVDLPGYGFAKVSSKLREQWGKEITVWLKSESRLESIVVLVDGRHGFMELDLELIEFLKLNSLPFLVAFTKMDKWKSANQRKAAEQDLKKFADKLEISKFIFVSSMSKEGIRPLEIELRKLRST